VSQLGEEATPDLKQEVGEPSAERREIRTPPRISRTAPIPTSLSPKQNLPLIPSQPSVASDDVDGPHQSPTKKASSNVAALHPFAQVSGRRITKYTLPHSQVLEKRGSMFPFLGPTVETPKLPAFKEGDQCITPYGPGKVVKVREKQGKHCIVVVEMVGWTATAYLKLELLKPVPKSLLGSLFRQFSGAEGTPASGVSACRGPLKRPWPLPVTKPHHQSPLVAWTHTGDAWQYSS
jgi:hypothetical protein